jgi:hypothetical protein
MMMGQTETLRTLSRNDPLRQPQLIKATNVALDWLRVRRRNVGTWRKPVPQESGMTQPGIEPGRRCKDPATSCLNGVIALPAYTVTTRLVRSAAETRCTSGCLLLLP